MNIFLLRHSEERLMQRENLIRPLRHCEERLVRRGNLIYQNFLMLLIYCLRVTFKKERHPPRHKTAPLHGGELFNLFPD